MRSAGRCPRAQHIGDHAPMDRMQRLAELAVTFGANVQPGRS